MNRVLSFQSPSKVFHPLKAESLTPGAVGTVTWATSPGWDGPGGGSAEGVDLWLIKASGNYGDGERIGSGVGADCRVRDGDGMR